MFIFLWLNMHFHPSFYAMYNEKEEKKSYNPAHSHPKASPN